MELNIRPVLWDFPVTIGIYGMTKLNFIAKCNCSLPITVIFKLPVAEIGVSSNYTGISGDQRKFLVTIGISNDHKKLLMTT